MYIYIYNYSYSQNIKKIQNKNVSFIIFIRYLICYAVVFIHICNTT